MKPKNPDLEGWSTVGVAWETETGFSLQLSRGVNLDWSLFHTDYPDSSRFALILVPADYPEEGDSAREVDEEEREQLRLRRVASRRRRR